MSEQLSEAARRMALRRDLLRHYQMTGRTDISVLDEAKIWVRNGYYTTAELLTEIVRNKVRSAVEDAAKLNPAEGMTKIRTVAGREIRHVGHGYVTVIDGVDSEISDRAPGEIFVSMGATGENILNILFVPDTGTGDLKFVVHRRSGNAGWGIFSDDEILLYDSRSVGRSQTFRFERDETMRINFDDALRSLVE